MEGSRPDVYAELSPRLSALSFRLASKSNRFVRRFPGGNQVIKVIAHEAHDYCGYMVQLGVRFHAVEALEKMRSIPGRYAVTIGENLGRLECGGPETWVWEGAGSLWTEMLSRIEQVGVPYLERYSSMETALSCVLDNGQAGRKCQSVPYQRAKAAVGLAIVLKKSKHEIEQIIESKRRALLKQEAWQREEFEEFLEAQTELL